MSNAKKLLGAALAALLLLSAVSGPAAALSSLEFSRTTLNLLSFELTIEGFTQVICEIGLSTTLDTRALAKTANVVIGRVTGIVLACSKGEMVFLTTPWNVKYKSFSGSLPRISGFTFQIQRMEFSATDLLTCLIIAEVSGLQRVRAETGSVGALEGRPFALETVNTAGDCTRETVQLKGTLLPMNGPITVRLI